MKYYQVKPVLERSVRGVCRKPYPGHPKGCIKYGKSDECPPTVPLFEKIIDISKPVYLIYNRFDLEDQVKRMLESNPEWSLRQARCLLYWQKGARKVLKGKTDMFLIENPGYKILTVPEACGVNMVETIKQIGITLEWPPKKYTYQVALAGMPL